MPESPILGFEVELRAPSLLPKSGGSLPFAGLVPIRLALELACSTDESNPVPQPLPFEARVSHPKLPFMGANAWGPIQPPAAPKRSHRSLIWGTLSSLLFVGWLLHTSGAHALERPLRDAREYVRQRAEVILEADFRGNLDDWNGRAGSKPAWVVEKNGFVRPRGLAVFRPTASMSDYTVDFLASAEQGIGTAFRVSDWNHYYGVEIHRAGGAPETELLLVRYAVVNGAIRNRTVRRFPPPTRNASLLRLHLEVAGPTFTLMNEDHIVDYWSDGRYTKGGVGFFGGNEERARLYWVRVSHQSDWVGRFFALLAYPETLAH